ncbi:hypothetical protein F183_A40700 [Bryobacterales bacterium F-183]|nr:hypothetical protein F183_A40700 [Bryobacterales bacterium F-183]
MTLGLDQTFALRDGGELHVDDAGLSLRSKKHGVQVWTYEHLQEVKLEASRMHVVTYEDGPGWKFGADKGRTFQLARGSFAELEPLLRSKLDRRLVTAMAEVPNGAEWSVAVKRLGTVKGSEGTLYVAKDRVVYLSAVPGESRTWRLQDIENVNSSGMYELTLTTYERARMSYGSMRSLNFRLKQPIDAARVDALWRRLQRPGS